jgi:hypothetical protein
LYIKLQFRTERQYSVLHGSKHSPNLVCSQETQEILQNVLKEEVVWRRRRKVKKNMRVKRSRRRREIKEGKHRVLDAEESKYKRGNKKEEMGKKQKKKSKRR